MSTWSNTLAPELFNTYMDWYDNYLDETRREPSEQMKALALEYFARR